MEKVKASEAHFKLFAAEVPVKQQVGRIVAITL